MDYDKWRDELLAIPVTNIDLLHKEHLRVLSIPRRDRLTTATELVRWSEWALGRAVYEAQRRGEVSSRVYVGGTPVDRYLGKGTGVSDYCRDFQHYSLEQMAQALFRAQIKGSLAAPAVIAELKEVVPAYLPLKEAGLTVSPTKRGERLLRELALSLASLASACKNVHPMEVDARGLHELVKQAQLGSGEIEYFLDQVVNGGK